jgi:hypothetical protein
VGGSAQRLPFEQTKARADVGSLVSIMAAVREVRKRGDAFYRQPQETTMLTVVLAGVHS